MDGNKDEALKCLKIGQEALEIGDRNRALKFITKARRLDPGLSVEDILSKLQEESSDTGSRKSSAGNSSARLRVPSSGSSSAASSSNSARPSYTEEQISIVRQIKKQKDYYEILGLERTCTIEDVRKAYRKLSLKVHPDKNKAPGAEEAFKAVSKAFQCLSKEDSRKRYDLVGSEEVIHERPMARRAQHGFNGFYEADIDAEEIFRNFFFGGTPGATTQFSGFTFRTGDRDSGNFNPRALIQLLPILLVLLLNFLPSSEPIYALSRSYSYEHRYVSQKGVNYFVKMPNFEEKYPPSSQERAVLEEQVEKDYVSIITQHCRQELQRRHWGYTNETPYCDRLNQFKAAA